MNNILERHRIIAKILSNETANYTLFDAGARLGVLSSLLTPYCIYTAGDKNNFTNSVSMIDLNEKLPFNDSCFDYVTALDVLEHLIDPWRTFDELVRISNKKVMISLPNMAYIEFRLRFLKKGFISGKYSFTLESVKDRHTWVTTHNEYINFANEVASKHNLHLSTYPIYPERGRTKFILSPLEHLAGRILPNLFEYGVIYTFEKRA